MFIPKRWLVPGLLSLVLLTMSMAVALAGFGPTSGTEPIDIAARNPYLDSELARSMSDPALCNPVVAEPVAALTAQEEHDIRLYLEALEANKTIMVTDAATNSGEITDSQFNDGGFGDIGQQWREVEVAAPVTNIHISGTGNVTTIVVGDDNTVVIGDDPVIVEEPPVAPLDPSLVSTPVEAPAPAPVAAPEAAPAPVVEAPAPSAEVPAAA
jgi:hypothetical protein